MADYLLDTGILIRILRRNQAYVRLIKALSAESDLYISAFTRIEIIRGMRGHEHEATYGLLDSFLTIPLGVSEANLAGELIRSQKEQGFMLHDADAAIAASALHHGLELLTTNSKGFTLPNLVVWSVNLTGELLRP